MKFDDLVSYFEMLENSEAFEVFVLETLYAGEVYYAYEKVEQVEDEHEQGVDLNAVDGEDAFDQELDLDIHKNLDDMVVHSDWANFPTWPLIRSSEETNYSEDDLMVYFGDDQKKGFGDGLMKGFVGGQKKGFVGGQKTGFEGGQKKGIGGGQKISFEGDQKLNFEGGSKKGFVGGLACNYGAQELLHVHEKVDIDLQELQLDDIEMQTLDAWDIHGALGKYFQLVDWGVVVVNQLQAVNCPLGGMDKDTVQNNLDLEALAILHSLVEFSYYSDYDTFLLGEKGVDDVESAEEEQEISVETVVVINEIGNQRANHGILFHVVGQYSVLGLKDAWMWENKYFQTYESVDQSFY